ncbi:MAG: ATP-dependent RNA helicase DbpA [Pseudomonadota bacterium]
MTDAVEFTDLPLAPALFQGLDAAGHVRMTPVQARALPPMLEGRDALVQAPTGSGKTVAFGLALLHALDSSRSGVQALVLCPTRELAEQVARTLRRLATGLPNVKLLTLTGGVPLAPHLASLVHPPHVVVGTPGRVLELVEKGALDLSGASTVVLDEADRMLDMGFEEPLRAILAATPRQRRTLLFSATYPEPIREMARAAMSEPVEIRVDDAAQAPDIEQRFIAAEPERKLAALAGLLLEQGEGSAVVFCNMRRDVDEVAGSLAHLGFSALALHGDMEQRDREEVLVRFANRSCTVLVASDVAARGLDVEDVALVVNYDVPSDADTYTHRVGRTGRAGRAGRAATLVSSREAGRLRALEERLGALPAAGRAPEVQLRPGLAPRAAMATLRIDAGRSDKLRPGDVLGALTGEAGLPGEAIGRIDIFPTRTYVAVRAGLATKALERLQAGRIKGRRFRVRRL